VLNVTYRKDKRKQADSEEGSKDVNGESASNVNGDSSQKGGSKAEAEGQQRIISHSQEQKASDAVPQVTFENNRHLIPENLFRVPPRSLTPDYAKRGFSSSPRSSFVSNSEDGDVAKTLQRPSLQQHDSWGYTMVNRKLKDLVLRDVFAPPVIHRNERHREHRPTRSLRKLPNSLKDSLASNSLSTSNIAALNEESATTDKTRRQAMRNVQRIRLDESDRSVALIRWAQQECGRSRSGTAGYGTRQVETPQAAPQRRRPGQEAD
jgi:inositol-hexakisphosphate kinase